MVKRNKKVRNAILLIAAVILGLGLINVLATQFFYRVDLTAEKRYTLANSTKKILQNLDDYVYVKCYLKGDYPSGFRRLQNSTQEILEEFSHVGAGKIRYEFIDVKEGRNEQQQKDLRKQLEDKGINPIRLNTQSDDNYKEQIVYPWCLVTYRDKEVPVFILNNQMGKSSEEQLNNSVALLEYNLIDAISRSIQNKRKRIAVADGNEEMPPGYMMDFIKTLSKDFDVAPVNINEMLRLPADKIDLLMIIKPTIAFSEPEKFKIDQFIMNGGKTLWLLDALDGDIDSLRRRKEYIAPDFPLNLDDQLFTYGVRLNKNFIEDYSCAPLPMVTGYVNNEPQYQLFPWVFFPVLMNTSSHPIAKNLDAILTLFPSSLDTVGNHEIRKTVLLQSSKYSRVQYSPVSVDLRMMKAQLQPSYFNKPNQIVSVLLEGDFRSPYVGRITPETFAMMDSLQVKFRAQSEENKMIVVSDGDIVKNPTSKKDISYPCGYYPFTRQTFANKDFLMNCVKYLIDNNGVIESRGKEIKLRLLDNPKVKEEANKWRIINIFIPLVLILLIGIIFNYVREKKFSVKN